MVVLYVVMLVLTEMFAEKYIKTSCSQTICNVQVQSEDRTLDETLKSSRCQLSDEDVTPRDSPSHQGSGDGTTSPYSYRGKREAPPYRDPPGLVSPVQRALPPYRDPPPVSSPARSSTPRTPGPLPAQDNRSDILSSPPSSSGKMKTKRNLMKVCAKLYPNFNYVIKILCMKKPQTASLDSVYCPSSHLLSENIDILIYKVQYYQLFSMGVKLGL